jgi:hypothetical protein
VTLQARAGLPRLRVSRRRSVAGRQVAKRDTLRRHRLLEALARGERTAGAARAAGYSGAGTARMILSIMRRETGCTTTIELVVRYREGEIDALFNPRKKRHA